MDSGVWGVRLKGLGFKVSIISYNKFLYIVKYKILLIISHLTSLQVIVSYLTGYQIFLIISHLTSLQAITSFLQDVTKIKKNIFP